MGITILRKKSIYIPVVITMAEVPMWLRILDVILGIVAIILAFAVIIWPAFFVLYGIAVILGVVLIILGIAGIFKALFPKGITTNERALNAILGLIMLIFGALFIAAPTFFPMLLVFVMAGGVLIIGVFMLIQGALGKELKKLVRYLLIIFGFIAIGIAIPAFFFWATWGTELVNMIIAIGLIVFGILGLVIGITGDYD